VGEQLRVRCTHKFGFGVEALIKPPIPASSDLEFMVEVLEVRQLFYIIFNLRKLKKLPLSIRI
jgi:hypothetical protein